MREKSRSKGANKKRIKIIALVVASLLVALALTGCVALDGESAAPEDTGAGPLGQMLGSRSQSLQILGILTILSLAPALLIMLTGFTRIIIVLSFTRNALGTQSMPPNQVLVGLALFLTFFVMTPVFTQIDEQALQPYIREEMTFDEAVSTAEKPLKEFMLRQTGNEELKMFLSIAEEEMPQTDEEKLALPMTTVIPAFLISEIKRAFLMGFLIYIPFIVIDMVVASTLMAMGMMMLPPTVISLPFKVLLFVLVDGWTLTVQSLITSFG